MNTPCMRRRLTILAVVTGAALGAGCVGYNVYPSAAGERGFTNVNSDPFPALVTESLKWAVTRYPPDASTEFSAAAPAGPGQTPFAVNMPAGTSAMVAERIVKNIGFNAQPLVPGNERLPIYHIARVWVSGDDAKVDIVRPILGFAGAEGQQATQGITVRLRGGMRPWTVTSHRVWSFNAMAVPALNYLPEQTGSRVERAFVPATPSDSR